MTDTTRERKMIELIAIAKLSAMLVGVVVAVVMYVAWEESR